MRILVVGSGGREHALAWKISRSPLVRALFAAPGNPGISRIATPVALRSDDVEGLARWARENRMDLVVVGPEAPLVAGLADRIARDGIPVFGPSAAAAEIEGSKAFAKDVMQAAGIPTAEYEAFTELAPAVAWARARAGRVVVKADGLAAGKGVVVCASAAEAEEALRAMLVGGAHGDAGRKVVVEERLEGPEASCIAFTDGQRVLEFNARLGDPETQPILMRLRNDIVPALLAAAQGDLSGVALDFDPRAAVGVVLAAEGYPGKVASGDVVEGADGPFPDDVQVFHAGTAAAADGRAVTSGGRVLTVCALGH